MSTLTDDVKLSTKFNQNLLGPSLLILTPHGCEDFSEKEGP